MPIDRRTFIKGAGLSGAALLFGSRSARAQVPGRGVAVWAHYCNWSAKKAQGQYSTWPDANTRPLYSDGYCVRPASAPRDFDCLMGYDSLDRATVEHHNEEMQAYGINPLISWWGRTGTINEDSGDVFMDLYVSVPSPVKPGILYEVTGLLVESELAPTVGSASVQTHLMGTDPFRVRRFASGRAAHAQSARARRGFDFGDGNPDNNENAARFISDVTYLYNRYWRRYPERFLTVDGRPVLFLWLSHAFAGRFDVTVAKLRQTVPVYIVGSNFGVTLPQADNPDFLATMRGLDAVSAYGIYNGEVATRHEGHLANAYVDDYVIAALRWSAWMRDALPGTKIILPTQFTYHDNRPGNSYMDKTTPAEAQYLATRVRALIEQSRQGCANVSDQAILHVSHSENFEGTAIEPSKEYGAAFANILHDTFSPPLAPIPSLCQF